MSVRLITTTDASGRRGRDLRRLIESIEANAATANMPIRMHLLIQNHSAATPDAAFPDWCTVLTMPGSCSLSEARNRVLRGLHRDGAIADDDIIGFPDDDCWLPECLLGHLVAIFRQRPNLGLLICRCSLRPRDGVVEAICVRTASVSQIVRLSSSNNAFYRGSVLKSVGLFDEDLGLGTRIGGSEDTDFAIRASFIAEASGFVDGELVGHTAPSRETAVRYFRGSLVVLARHGHRSPALALEFLRKICVGMIFVASRRITATSLGESLFLAVRQRVALRVHRPT